MQGDHETGQAHCSRQRLEGKVAVVVGAGQSPGTLVGNGRAAAIAFAREGARLLLVDRDPASLGETAEMVNDEGFDAQTQVVDVTDDADCARVAESACECFGRIDVLHHSVGLGSGGREGPEEIADWDRLMSVNIRGFFSMIRHTLPVMREQGSGVVVAVSSVAAVVTGGALGYKASKAGMNAMVGQLAVENGPFGIRVNAIMPGLMATPGFFERQARAKGLSLDELRAARDSVVPLRHEMGTAWDVAKAAVFLASDEASYISGAILPVDGGLSARTG